LILVVAVVLVGVALAGAEFAGSLGDADVGSPGVGTWLATGALVTLGQSVLSASWPRLVGRPDDWRALTQIFHVTQPAKYVPAGVAQILGLVALTTDRGVPTARATAGWVAHALSLVAPGIAIGSGIALVTSGWWRLLGLGLLAPVVLDRRLLAVAIDKGRGLIKRLPDASTLPTRRSLIEAGLAGAIFMLTHGAGYAVLADALGAEVSPIRSVCAYALAVSVSIVTPMPGGLGVREAVLVASAGAPPEVTLAAALLLRVALITMELAIIPLWALAVRLNSHPRRGHSGGAGTR